MTKKQLVEWLDKHVPDDTPMFVELDMGQLEPVNPNYRPFTEEDSAVVDRSVSSGLSVGDFVATL